MRFSGDYDQAFGEGLWVGAHRPGSSAHEELLALAERLVPPGDAAACGLALAGAHGRHGPEPAGRLRPQATPASAAGAATPPRPRPRSLPSPL